MKYILLVFLVYTNVLFSPPMIKSELFFEKSIIEKQIDFMNVLLTIHMEAAYCKDDINLVTQVIINRIFERGVTNITDRSQFSCWAMSKKYIDNRRKQLTLSRLLVIFKTLVTTTYKPKVGCYYTKHKIKRVWMKYTVKTIGSKYHQARRMKK